MWQPCLGTPGRRKGKDPLETGDMKKGGEGQAKGRKSKLDLVKNLKRHLLSARFSDADWPRIIKKGERVVFNSSSAGGKKLQSQKRVGETNQPVSSKSFLRTPSRDEMRGHYVHQREG